MNRKRFITAAFLAWIIFIAIDFIFHGSILNSLWGQQVESIKPLQDLTRIIPAGYISFLLLVILSTYVFTRIFPSRPTMRKMFTFAVIFGLLFALSYLLGLYSFVNIPLKHLIAFSLVYLIELIAVFVVFHWLYYAIRIKIRALIIGGIFLLLVIIGIIVQNTTEFSF